MNPYLSESVPHNGLENPLVSDYRDPVNVKNESDFPKSKPYVLYEFAIIYPAYGAVNAIKNKNINGLEDTPYLNPPHSLCITYSYVFFYPSFVNT